MATRSALNLVSSMMPLVTANKASSKDRRGKGNRDLRGATAAGGPSGTEEDVEGPEDIALPPSRGRLRDRDDDDDGTVDKVVLNSEPGRPRIIRMRPAPPSCATSEGSRKNSCTSSSERPSANMSRNKFR